MSTVETLQYLKALYGRCSADDGAIVLVESSKTRPAGVFRLQDIQKAADEAGKHLDCYLKINLMDSQAIANRLNQKLKTNDKATAVGNRNEVKTIVSFHLDVDAGKSSKYHSRDEVLSILDRMPVPPSLIVNSDGTEGGFHAYWLLLHPVRITDDFHRQRLSAMTLRWQARLKSIADDKIDSTANIDRVLRVPGTMRANGNRVSIHQYHPDRLYDIDDLYILPDRQEIEKDAQRVIRRLFDRILGPSDASDLPIQSYIDREGITPELLLEEAGYKQLSDPEQWRRPGASGTGRSLKIATQLDRPGINVFSGGDEQNFPCHKRDGGVGRFYSVDAMFVILRHGKDWDDAAKWCREQLKPADEKFVDLEAAGK